MTDDDGDLALLGDLLDHSFDAGPGGMATPADRLAEGRRALRRRRRIGLVASSLGVVAAVGVGVALSGTGVVRGTDGPRPPVGTNVPTATPSTVSPSPSAPSTPTAAKLRKAEKEAQRYLSESIPASYDGFGRLVVKDGWDVVQQVENPLGLVPPETSLGLVLTNGTTTRWVMISREHAVDAQGHQLANAFGDSGAADDPGKGYSRFEDWLASMVELQGGPRTPPLVTIDAQDTLEPGPGAVLVEIRPAPAIADNTSEGDRLAEVERDGRTWFVVVRGHGPRADVIPVDADVLSAPTFDALIDHIRSQAASGEGLR